MTSSPEFSEAAARRPQLGLTDFTLLVIGAIVGDGIYVVGALGAQALGPAQLLAWVVAGLLAGLIGLAFVQCAAIDHEAGGSYSYARIAFGPFAGFMAGWTLYIGEWTALAAFPTAFFNYFHALTGAPDSLEIPVKVALVAGAVLVNLAGIRQGARTNDLLTAAKLVPLALLIIAGLAYIALHTSDAEAHVSPFTPLGLSGFSQAILPIFWAFAGFELAVLPAGDVQSPSRNLPRGLLIGVAVSTAFYLLVCLAITVAAPWQEVAASNHPLATVMDNALTTFGGPADAGARLMSLGGLISIAGVCVVFSLALARLSQAMAVDGFLHHAFAIVDRRGTPYVGIVFQALAALLFSTLFSLGPLLSSAVLFLSFCYLLTALAALRLVRDNPDHALHVPKLHALLIGAAVASLFLTLQASLTQLAIAGVVIGLGLVLYQLHARHGRVLAQGGGLHVEAHPHYWLHRSMRRRRFRTAPLSGRLSTNGKATKDR